jgi:hypothetical protein
VGLSSGLSVLCAGEVLRKISLASPSLSLSAITMRASSAAYSATPGALHVLPQQPAAQTDFCGYDLEISSRSRRKPHGLPAALVKRGARPVHGVLYHFMGACGRRRPPIL